MSSPFATVTIVDNTIKLKRSGQSEIIEAKILGEEERGGKRVIYADRLIHEPYEKTFDTFLVHGAISTILTSI